MNQEEPPGRGGLVLCSSSLENNIKSAFNVPRFDTATRAAAVGGVTTLVDILWTFDSDISLVQHLFSLGGH